MTDYFCAPSRALALHTSSRVELEKAPRASACNRLTENNVIRLSRIDSFCACICVCVCELGKRRKLIDTAANRDDSLQVSSSPRLPS